MSFKFLIDENCRDHRFWHAILQHNSTACELALDVVRVGDSGAPPRGTRDDDLLQWSIAMGRSIVSRDENTLIGYHDDLVRSGQRTTGLFLIRAGVTIPSIVEALVLIAHASTPEEWEGLCCYVPPESHR